MHRRRGPPDDKSAKPPYAKRQGKNAVGKSKISYSCCKGAVQKVPSGQLEHHGATVAICMLRHGAPMGLVFALDGHLKQWAETLPIKHDNVLRTLAPQPHTTTPRSKKQGRGEGGCADIRSKR